MNNFDYLALDGRLLRQFLAVYDTGSVTAAADSLGLTQSNISHNLERLNQLTGSRLFTRRGRGIVATEQGHTLAPRARRILQELAEIATQPDYRPAEDTGRFVIACNDYEREVLVKPLLTVLQKEAPRCQLQLLPLGSRDDILPALHRHQVDLVLSPLLTRDTSELHQQRLFSDEMVCFFQRGQPRPDNLERYLRARHIRVGFSANGHSDIDSYLASRKLQRDTALIVASFDAVASLMTQAPLVATLPARLGNNLLSGFDHCPSPIPLPELEIHQLWHQQHHSSARHRWLRSQVRQLADNP